MQGEQRERLMALAAQVAVENDRKKFHALLVELDRLLRETVHPIRVTGKNPPQSPSKPLNK